LLFGVWSGSLKEELMIVVETVRKWMLIIEGSSEPFYIYPE
jgi:hypothetical protein